MFDPVEMRIIKDSIRQLLLCMAALGFMGAGLYQLYLFLSSAIVTFEYSTPPVSVGETLRVPNLSFEPLVISIALILLAVWIFYKSSKNGNKLK